MARRVQFAGVLQALRRAPQEHHLPTISSFDSPPGVGMASAVAPPASPVQPRALAVKPEPLKAVLIGASVAATLALVVVVLRARSRRRAALADTSSGVLRVILKGALYAAAQTVVQVAAARLAAKALHHDSNRAPVEAATD
jgi:hypothetical protein